ncbi:AAA family ATPase [Phlyctema vagabunda]|uniref:AAA family ATPase n=1 Tax=Phlyctema vagabunda TaxID=108571 RepID=A0ABR4PTJ0_9HELO
MSSSGGQEPEKPSADPKDGVTASENSTVIDAKPGTKGSGSGSDADAEPKSGSDARSQTSKASRRKKRRERVAASLRLDKSSSDDGGSTDDYATDRLKERRKKSQHWRRQANRYGWVLEDRIAFLEKRLTELTGEELISKDDKSDKTGDKSHSPEPEAKSEGIRILTWQEYCVDKGGRWNDLKCAKIDVLLEEALPFNPHGRVSRSGMDKAPIQTKEELMARAKDFDRLPERIRINSRPIQEMLRNISRSDEVGFVSDTSTIVYIKPFKMLFSLDSAIRECHQDQERLLASLKEKKDDAEGEEKSEESQLEISELETEVKDIACLIQMIDIFLKPIQLRLDTATSSSSIRFEELWLLFKPGCYVVVNEREVTQRVWKVMQKTGGRKYLRPRNPRDYDEPGSAGDFGGDISSFLLDCCYIDFNGSQLGVVMETFSISSFDSRRPIKSLNVYPLEKAEQEFLDTKHKLRENGELFLEHTKVQHRYYSGKALAREPSGAYLDDYVGTDVAATVESAVVVDFGMTFQFQYSWQPNFTNSKRFSIDDQREYQEVHPSYDPLERKGLTEGQDWLRPDNISRDFEWDLRDKIVVQANLDMEKKRWDQGINPSGDSLLLLPSRVFGYVLKTRAWAPLKLNLLKKIYADKDALADLQLPNGYLDVIQSMVEWQFSIGGSTKPKNEPEFDVVRNKGRGLIILLHGAPGLGKTSTAECIANANSKPLLSITCGSLGKSAEQVESGLQRLFRLAQAWDCVLLLDEADVFLAERTLQDMTRNGIVSVFLRTLEYYEGILFLTTNRVGELDEAFRSRIHVALYYPPLDVDRTYKVWEMQIRRLYKMVPDLVCNKQGILDYGTRLFSIQNQKKPGTGWNGRQIRNAFQSAMALARFRSTKVPGTPIELLVQDFEQVTTAANEFDDYLYRTRGRYEPDRAKFNQLRAGERPQAQPQHHASNSRGYNNTYYPTTPEFRPRALSSEESFESSMRTNYLSPQNIPSQSPHYGNQNVENGSRQQTYQQQQFSQPPQSSGYSGIQGSGQAQGYSVPHTTQFQQGQVGDPPSGIPRQFNMIQPQQHQQPQQPQHQPQHLQNQDSQSFYTPQHLQQGIPHHVVPGGSSFNEKGPSS